MAQKSIFTSIDIASLVNAMKLVFPTKEEVVLKEAFEEKIRLLPTKEEFFSRMDKLSGEYKKIDKAETIHAGQLSEHDDTLESHDERIKALESRHGSKPAPLVG